MGVIRNLLPCVRGHILRRDLRCGLVLLNPPNAPPQVISLPEGYITIEGRPVAAVELTAANPAAVLLKSCATLGANERQL